jgi:hypothetical protein
MSEPQQPNNVVENESIDLPAPAPANTKLIVILVVLIVIGFSSVPALLGYMYASKTLPTSKMAPETSVSEVIKPAIASPTPLASTSPKPTLSPNQYGNTFNSSALGIGFYYAAKITGSNELIDVVEKDNTVYVFAKGTTMESGQYVQRFFKDPSVSLEAAITDQFLKNIPTDKCYVKELSRLEQGIIKATIDYPVPANSGEPFFMFGEECPEKYKRSNGMSYFYYDPKVSDRYFYFSIGQYSIPAYSNSTKTSWQDTFMTY